MAKTQTFNLRLSDEHRAHLDAIADAHGVSRAQVVLILIETAYARLERTQETPHAGTGQHPEAASV